MLHSYYVVFIFLSLLKNFPSEIGLFDVKKAGKMTAMVIIERKKNYDYEKKKYLGNILESAKCC